MYRTLSHLVEVGALARTGRGRSAINPAVVWAGSLATRELTAEATPKPQALTPAQLMRLGPSRHQRYLYQTLKTLRARRPAPVGRLDFGVLPGRGRLPAIFYLTHAGAELLADQHLTTHGEEIAPPAVPERVRMFWNDYDHRRACVDVHIAVRQWAQRHSATVDVFDTYFDHGRKEKERPVARTRVALQRGVLVPDAVFSLATPDSTRRLFALELSAGRETARIERQLDAYRYALHEAAIERSYGYEHAVAVLCVFSDERTLARVRDRLERRADFRGFREYLLFKTSPEVAADFHEGWRQIGVKGRVLLFPQ